MDTLVEFNGLHYVGLNNWFEVKCGWSYKLDKGVLYCDASRRIDGAMYEATTRHTNVYFIVMHPGVSMEFWISLLKAGLSHVNPQPKVK